MIKKLIIFDCDGVLVDSEIIASRIESQMLIELGFKLSEEQVLRRFTGISSHTMVERLKQESNILFPDNFIDAMQSRIIDALENAVQPLMIDLLEYLNNNSIERAVASGSPRNRVLRCLAVTQQIRFFKDNAIFTAQQVNKGKPAPDLFLFAAEKMGCSPKDCIVIEDSTAGFEAALAANMQVIGFVGATHAKYDSHYKLLEKYNVPLLKTAREIISFINLSLARN